MIARQPLVVPFTKMHGAGNDFVVLDNRFLHFTADELGEIARRVCARRTAVGADGLLALDPPGTPPEAGASGDGSASPQTDFRMRYRNADGSLGTMCGNGARCLARFAARAGLGRAAEDGTTHLAFGTDGGRYTARVTPERPGPPEASGGDAGAAPRVTLDVPPPRAWETPEAASPLGAVHPIWTGTEHTVLLVESADDAPVAEEGARLRAHSAFAPTGTNVNFVQATGPGAVRARTFEKGVEAETLACGTGALAAALVAHREGAVRGDAVRVEMPGGTLVVGLGASGGPLTLGGPAEIAYEGTLEWWG